MEHSVNRKEILVYLGLLTLFFIFFEISFFVQCNQTYLSDFNYVNQSLTIPLRILPDIIFYISAQLTLHLALTITIWCLSILLCKFYQFEPNRALIFSLAIWLLCMNSILLMNQYFFPLSRFAGLSGSIFGHSSFFFFSLIINVSFMFLLFANACYIFIKTYFVYALITLSLIFNFYVFYQAWSAPKQLTIGSEEHPNIIIVGMDSLRPDFLSYFGAEYQTPFMDNFLNHAVVFGEAITPLARTFPSWISILTGKYPYHTGTRFNLANTRSFNTETLPQSLTAVGYQSLYATDESRFSNIDQKFGFDNILLPPIGLNDFLLGTFNDFPLSNLLVNTSIGKLLFPYNHANRAAFFTYQPNTFLTDLQLKLNQLSSQPLFLAIHFCLPHFPYTWAGIEENKSMRINYQNSILAIDKQIENLFQLLKKSGLLNHAIVVLLSDHGEALELKGDRITEAENYIGNALQGLPHFYPSSLDNEEINQSAGHGTDVLGLPQYHSLLAFKTFGLRKKFTSRLIAGPVSLIDIAPTIFDLLQLKKLHANFDGTSLYSIIRNTKSTVPVRHLLLESDFTPQAIRTVYPNIEQAILEGIQIFEIDQKTTRLTVKPGMDQMIINSKQYADIFGEWMLAVYPQANEHDISILINLATGNWTDDLSSGFALNSPARQMKHYIETFYQIKVQ